MALGSPNPPCPLNSSRRAFFLVVAEIQKQLCVARRGVSRRARASGAAKRVGRARGTACEGWSTHDHPSHAARAAPTAAQAPAPGGSRRAETVPIDAESTLRNSTVQIEHRVVCIELAPRLHGGGQGRLRAPVGRAVRHGWRGRGRRGLPAASAPGPIGGHVCDPRVPAGDPDRRRALPQTTLRKSVTNFILVYGATRNRPGPQLKPRRPP